MRERWKTKNEIVLVNGRDEMRWNIDGWMIKEMKWNDQWEIKKTQIEESSCYICIIFTLFSYLDMVNEMVDGKWDGRWNGKWLKTIYQKIIYSI